MIEFQSRIDSDGRLNLQVPPGVAEANADVIVTIRPLASNHAKKFDPVEWHRFVNETYGSCAGLGLERQPQGEFEKREAFE